MEAGALLAGRPVDPRDLYALPLERFTDERGALAKRLRQERQREEATRVSGLRKPSAAAWAVNQLIRTQRREITALFDAGDALSKAQADLLAGKAKPGALRAALDAERAAVDELTEAARGLLSSDGHQLAQARLEQVSETLHAAALDEESRTQVRDGCLVRELRHVGLGPMAAPATATSGTASRSKRAPSPAKPARKQKAAAPAAQVKAARKLLADARRRMERAARELKSATERRERAAEALHGAEETLAEARKVAEKATLEHRRAKAALADQAAD